MLPEILPIRKSLNQAYRKVKPNRSQIESFKSGIISLFDQVKETESEEHHKNIIIEFLKNTYYHPEHYVNTKERTDLVIHNGKDSKSSVGVIIETKRPGNKAEMPTKENINSKAVQELLLYFLRERISGKNLEIKNLIATNLYEWFIFDSQDFEKVFAKNKKLVTDYEKFEAGSLSGTTTEFFYNNIAKPFIDEQEVSIPVTWFDLRDFEHIVKNDSKEDDKKLIEVYKILSPEHLLKLPFSNDSNTLDKKFYNELLHIIGLEEKKEKSKKLIGRKAEGKRDNGSLIENAIKILNYEDCLRDIKNPSEYGENKDEQLYHIALELSITWINRILFLKLLEGQLIKYHAGDTSYKFLNAELIPDYDALNKLFFHVLAVKENERGDHVKEKYRKIPYLNSSLFEPNELEHRTIRISNLEDDYTLPILSGTVLKDYNGKKKKGNHNPLNYLFEFLDSYDFSSEGAEDISEENKTLINASVLGLIFEKINGYKDGSFFTPGFITMYMCRETIRRAVVQKFNDAKGWKCENLDDLYSKIDDKKEANGIINSLKICDPAVGSGHFLVSALNEIIAIKSELKILVDSKGKVLRDYHVEVVNDELVITDEDGKFFEYHPKNPESQRIQETLFHEKQTIIETCLFGVDINQNSVKICRLRLWIELLKNAYYRPDSGFTELETLPNIDINIKCGNSLISRYPLDADIKTALAKSKWSIDSYRLAVMSYRNAENKDEKTSMRDLINEIKSDFESEVSKSDKRFVRLNKLKGALSSLTGQQNLFEMEGKQKAEWEKKVKNTTNEINKLETELDEIRNNKIYENAFEWRFEFPEVLNDEGDFVGFDVLIGNPPYYSLDELTDNMKDILNTLYSPVFTRQSNIYYFFFVLANNIQKKNYFSCLITERYFFNAKNANKLRNWLLENFEINRIVDFKNIQIFDDVNTLTVILQLKKVVASRNEINILQANNVERKFNSEFKNEVLNRFNIPAFSTNSNWDIINPIYERIISKINENSLPLSEFVKMGQGIKTGLNEVFIVDKEAIKKNSLEKNILEKYIKTRDIKKYQIVFRELFIIRTLNETNLNEFKNTSTYLLQFKDNLEKRYQFKDGSCKWYALSIPQNLKIFKSKGPKIFTPMYSQKNNFAIGENYYGLTDIYVLKNISDSIGDNYLLGILNSNPLNFYNTHKGKLKRDNYFEYSKNTLSNWPIRIGTPENRKRISDLVEDLISSPANTRLGIEYKINEEIYKLYNLTDTEIQIIESNLL